MCLGNPQLRQLLQQTCKSFSRRKHSNRSFFPRCSRALNFLAPDSVSSCSIQHSLLCSCFVTPCDMGSRYLKCVANCRIGREKFRRPFSRAMKKKPYSSPTIRELTPEQARKLIADRKNCSEEEAAESMESLKRQQVKRSA